MLVIIYGHQWILNCQFLFNIYFALVHFWWLFPSLASVLVLFKLTFIPSSHNFFLNYANVLYHDKLSLKQSAFLKTNNFVDMLKVEWGQYPWLLPMLPRKLELILSQVQRYSCLNHFSSFHISPSSLWLNGTYSMMFYFDVLFDCREHWVICREDKLEKENLDYVHIFKILSRMDWCIYILVCHSCMTWFLFLSFMSWSNWFPLALHPYEAKDREIGWLLSFTQVSILRSCSLWRVSFSFLTNTILTL